MAHARVAKDSAHRERNSNPKVPKCPFLDKFSTNFPLEKIVQGVVVQLVMGLWCLNRKQDIHCYVNYFGHLLKMIGGNQQHFIWDTSISGFRKSTFFGSHCSSIVLWRVRPFTMRIDNAWVTLISVLYWHILSNRRLISYYRVSSRDWYYIFRAQEARRAQAASVSVPPHSVYPRLSCIQRMSSCLQCAKTFLVFFFFQNPYQTHLRSEQPA